MLPNIGDFPSACTFCVHARLAWPCASTDRPLLAQELAAGHSLFFGTRLLSDKGL